ncbi:CACTA transposable element [Cucumis melo var. makuwa]|uniref:CACTA transposable element n=1 Tax=Cucumis melo var. makuwa TaxID=1194695 RepID=A0A5D3BU07_CUCMM|nr:CACTA transposable element [Cucumis melo var. makuwa]
MAPRELKELKNQQEELLEKERGFGKRDVVRRTYLQRREEAIGSRKASHDAINVTASEVLGEPRTPCLTMDKSWMNIRNKLSIEYREGVFKFLDIVKYHVDEYGLIRYPAKDV